VLAESFCIPKDSAIRSASRNDPQGVGVSAGSGRMTTGVETKSRVSSSGEDITDPELGVFPEGADGLLKLRYNLPRCCDICVDVVDSEKGGTVLALHISAGMGSRDFLLFHRSDCSRLFQAVVVVVSLLLASLDDEGDRRQ
jgi:hypothetical protein